MAPAESFKKGYARARNNPNDVTPAGACLTLIVVLFLVALIVMLAWNIGVVGIVAAAGGHVAKISYWTALFGWIALRLIGAAVSKAVGK